MYSTVYCRVCVCVLGWAALRWLAGLCAGCARPPPTPPHPVSPLHSYEGTYEVNALVAGRGATGISAIKPPRRGGVQVQA